MPAVLTERAGEADQPVHQRAPREARRRGGAAARRRGEAIVMVCNRLFVGTFNASPRRLVRPLGWHLMAFCRT